MPRATAFFHAERRFWCGSSGLLSLFLPVSGRVANCYAMGRIVVPSGLDANDVDPPARMRTPERTLIDELATAHP